MAAYSGYCSGLSFALAWNGKLEGFDRFYQEPKEPTVPMPSVADHIEMMHDIGELSDQEYESILSQMRSEDSLFARV